MIGKHLRGINGRVQMIFYRIIFIVGDWKSAFGLQGGTFVYSIDETFEEEIKLEAL